ncbi:ENKUR protein, partial [Polypterus senegalus]
APVKEKMQWRASLYRSKEPLKADTHGPYNFLRKHSKEPKLPKKKPFRYPDHYMRKPPLPSLMDIPIMGIQNNRDYITLNAVEVIKGAPQKSMPYYTTKKFYDDSGCPIFIYKEDYGKLPEYIVRRREKQKEYETYLAEKARREVPKPLPESERQKIIQGLKNNWNALNRQYLCLPMVTDTVSKRVRWETLEKEMDELDKQIKRVEKQKFIFIKK